MEFLSLSRRRSSSRNVPSGEERGETDVFAGYFIGEYNNNAKNAIERCAPSGPQKHITKESGFHNHSTPLTMFARLPHWYARNMLATRQS